MVQWSEVQRLYPDQFVLLEELSSHYKDGKLYIEEVAVVRPIYETGVSTWIAVQTIFSADAVEAQKVAEISFTSYTEIHTKDRNDL